MIGSNSPYFTFLNEYVESQKHMSAFCTLAALSYALECEE